MNAPTEGDRSTPVALVTGAARGIGAATVRSLRAGGYRVLAIDSCQGDGPGLPDGVDYPLATRDDLNALADEQPDAVHTQMADVRDAAELATAAQHAVDTFGRLDVAVAAAAVIAGGQPLWQTPPSTMRTLWDVDVMGVFHTASACIPHMLAGPDPSRCRFVAVASAAGTHGMFGLAGYNTVKHATVGLIRGLAADLAGTGVTATAVAPGSTRTRMLEATAKLYGLDDADQFTSSTLIQRLLDPEEVAAAIAFCCSAEGAALNGSVVSTDGGFRA